MSISEIGALDTTNGAYPFELKCFNVIKNELANPFGCQQSTIATLEFKGISPSVILNLRANAISCFRRANGSQIASGII
jgi:hypothetical protein